MSGCVPRWPSLRVWTAVRSCVRQTNEPISLHEEQSSLFTINRPPLPVPRYGVTFNSMATAAFCKFFIFSVIEMRLLLVIWKHHNPEGKDESRPRELPVWIRSVFIL